jgi:hypothetical protein
MKKLMVVSAHATKSFMEYSEKIAGKCINEEVKKTWPLFYE